MVRISSGLRSPKKFADIGLVEGAQVVLEGYAPFGGLLRIRLLDCCMSLHRDEAVHILVRVEE
ncbi:MAG: ferrous iron transport protein A [Oligosphaeraceae bacterium]|nr:ferrous iron transport protein A [Oligosphaeraceae bacterium]